MVAGIDINVGLRVGASKPEDIGLRGARASARHLKVSLLR